MEERHRESTRKAKRAHRRRQPQGGGALDGQGDAAGERRDRDWKRRGSGARWGAPRRVERPRRSSSAELASLRGRQDEYDNFGGELVGRGVMSAIARACRGGPPPTTLLTKHSTAPPFGVVRNDATRRRNAEIVVDALSSAACAFCMPLSALSGDCTNPPGAATRMLMASGVRYWSICPDAASTSPMNGGDGRRCRCSRQAATPTKNAVRRARPLHALVRLVLAHERAPRSFELVHQIGVHLVPVPVPLVDERLRVVQLRFRRVQRLEDGATTRPSSHRAAAAHVVDPLRP